jgi:hypothetical protein
MAKRALSGAKKAHISVADARRAARAVKAKRGKGAFKISSKERARLLGHFGPPVPAVSKKRRGARKRARKLVAA